MIQCSADGWRSSVTLAEDLGNDREKVSQAKAPTASTEWDGQQGYIQTGVEGECFEPNDFDAILERFGFDPARVQIVGNPRISRWQRWDGDWLSAYRFHLGPRALASAPDIEHIVRRARAERRPGTGPHWFVFQAGDLQIGKRSRDGSTEEILDRYVRSVEDSVREFAALKRYGIEGIQVSFPGDCIEGNQSQQGKNLWLTQETITEQTRIFRRLIMYTIDAFAPLTGRVFVDVVNGNHDQAQRQQNTYPGDGWATEAAVSVSDALTLNPLAFGHVEVRVPEKWSGHMTVPVGDTLVTVTHGHQWRRNKAMDWWAAQAVNNQPPAASAVLQHGHWHEWRIESSAERMVIGSSTFDCGSDWYRETNGGMSRRGGLVYLLRAGEASRMTLV